MLETTWGDTFARTQLEGELLHKTVEMEKWAVTKDDLLQFRRLVIWKNKAPMDGYGCAITAISCLVYVKKLLGMLLYELF